MGKKCAALRMGSCKKGRRKILVRKNVGAPSENMKIILRIREHFVRTSVGGTEMK